MLWTRGVAARETLNYLDRRGIDAEPALFGAGISRLQLAQDDPKLPFGLLVKSKLQRPFAISGWSNRRISINKTLHGSATGAGNCRKPDDNRSGKMHAKAE